VTLALTYDQPDVLWLLLAVVLLAFLYVVMQLRRERYEVRFTNLELLDVVAPRRPRWRRHLTAAMFLLGISALVVAAARPFAEVRVPRERATVVLAIDVSFSMMADDVEPTRLDAAQEAAVDFVQGLPASMNVGLVAFDGTARVLVPPTPDRTSVQQAINGLQLGPSTAIGEAIFASLDAIEMAPPGEVDERAPGRIVLMSDGETTVGRPNDMGSDAATRAGVPVSTISFGTPFGEIVLEEEPVPIPVPVSPEPLRAVADATGGTFFEAGSLADLEDVYADIGTSIGYTTEEQEVTHRAVWVALALFGLTAAMSMTWFSRLP
jgi:Ca-activated chloride channel homolog